MMIIRLISPAYFRAACVISVHAAHIKYKTNYAITKFRNSVSKLKLLMKLTKSKEPVSIQLYLYNYGLISPCFNSFFKSYF